MRTDPGIKNMTVQIDIPLFLRHCTNGVIVANVNGNTVGDCLNYFVEQYLGAKQLLFNRDGKLLGHIEIHVNGVTTYPEELARRVNNGDEISILYLMSGG